ncbi:MAG: GNAT family N-acetyltransferase [Lachnospiraceae bacterium]|nr:GNAT family N-acetyltransferase [Lachnospiraceae bacterium]
MIISDGELALIVPSKELKEEALQYKEEHFAHGDMQVHGSGGLAYYDDYDAWLKHIDAIRKMQADVDVKTSTFFSRRLSDGKLIGCVKIHHTLNDELRNGGHVAYGIRPSEREKGYGTKQLRLILEFAKREGMGQVIVACDKDNVASARTAMSCGGVLLKEFNEDGIIKQHYFFEMKKVLCVGFKGKNNFSGLLAEKLSREHLLLTNSRDGLKKDVDSVRGEYDQVIMFGVDKTLTSTVRIERVAAWDGERIVSKLNLNQLKDSLGAAGIQAVISENPTAYLCNDAYWQALHKFSGKAVFIHVPTMRHADEIFAEKVRRAVLTWLEKW